MTTNWRAMAVRAAFAAGSDGIVFENDSLDTFEEDWEALDETTRRNWQELTDLLIETLRPSFRLTETPVNDTSTSHH